MNYDDLQLIAKEILTEANRLNILSKLYWYSPESRKLKPKSKIGYYERNPSGIRLAHGCKLIMVFPRLAFEELEPIINKHSSDQEQIAYRADFKCSEKVGFDVYQRVYELKLFIEPDMHASKRFTQQEMLKKGPYWAERQLEALLDTEPKYSEQQISKIITEVSDRFKKALEYLKSQNDTQAKLCVRRLSGVRHQMVKEDSLGEQTVKAGFSDLVLIFSSNAKLSAVTLPKEPNRTRKPRSDSISAQYKANPSSFKYYDKFGIFEVYDR